MRDGFPMRSVPLLLPALLATIAAGPGAAVTVRFDEAAGPAGLAVEPAAAGVHFDAGGSGSVWPGLSGGDPGRWGLEGSNGPAFLGFNGGSYGLVASFDAPVRGLRLDVSSSIGAQEGALFVLEGYRAGLLVERETFELGGVDEWQTAGLDAEVDQVAWYGVDDRFHPYGVDNLRWIQADVAPEPVDVELRPGTEQPLDPAAGGLMGAIVFGSAALPVDQVDETTLAIGPDGAGIAYPGTLNVRDVDGDGHPDLVTLYRVDQTGIQVTDREVCLTGETFAGAPFEGCAPLRVAHGAE